MTRRTVFGITAGSVLITAVLLMAFWGGHTTSLATNVEWWARAASRLAFLLCSPAIAASNLFWPVVDHHYRIENIVFACGTTGLANALVLAVGHWFVRRRRREILTETGASLSRREFLGASAASGLVFTTGGLGTYATQIEPRQLLVQRYDLPIRDLPEAFDGLKVLQFSDSHYGPFISENYLDGAITQANALEPDLVLLTGDYIHKYPETIDRGIGMLERLRSRFGSVAVMGNHEHWEGADACRKRISATGIPLIDNGRRYLKPNGLCDSPDPGNSICLAGLGDLWEDEVSFARALGDVPESVPRLVLSHNPDSSLEAEAGRFRVDAMFSGHTHGGQVSLPGFGPLLLPSQYGQRFAGGICEGTGFPVVVSRGVGMAFLPVRFRVPPELVLVRLTKRS